MQHATLLLVDDGHRTIYYLLPCVMCRAGGGGCVRVMARNEGWRWPGGRRAATAGHGEYDYMIPGHQTHILPSSCWYRVDTFQSSTHSVTSEAIFSDNMLIVCRRMLLVPGGADEVWMLGGGPGGCGHQRLGTSPHHHLT